jgi:hypothetical protein
MTRKLRDESEPGSDATNGRDPASTDVILDVVSPEALMHALQKATPSDEDDVTPPPHPEPRDS